VESAFAEALRAEQPLPDVWRNLGWWWHRRQAQDRAEEAYRGALALDPELALAWTGLGVLFLETGRVHDGRAALARAVETDPNLAEARYHYAFALSAAGDYQGALRETSRALELSPYITTPRFRLLVELQFENASVPVPELDSSERVPSGEPIDEFEFSPRALDNLDAAPAAADQDPGELDATRPAMAADPMAAPSAAASIGALAAARASLGSGQYAQALADAHRAASLGANRIEVQLIQGEAFLASGAAGEAVERFGAVLADLAVIADASAAGLDGADIEKRALAGLARSQLELGRGAEAVDAAQRLTKQAPGDPGAAVLLADALEEAGRADHVLEVLRRAVERTPDNVALLTRLGAAYADAGDLHHAEAVLRQALDLDSDAPATRATLARVLVAIGQRDQAAEHYRAALERIPSFDDAAFGLADLELARGNLREAIIVLATFLDVDPYNLSGLVRLGDVLWLSGQQAQAAVAYRRVLHFDAGNIDALEGLERLEPVVEFAAQPVGPAAAERWPARR
jgi:tetratricopeptide (TPR) repeat protein